ncbi:MAG: PA14 domain-containing protein [Verrucomicrobiota bacterium]|nr:PA14 domain-containing protein [Verrucomicrobiota bacterium]
MNSPFTWLLLALMLLAHPISTNADPIRLHPRNPHYFEYEGKPTILITSAEHYGALINLDFDFEKYLRTLKQDNLNNTRLFTGSYVEPKGAFNITRNTLAPEPERFISPWARSSQPGYANGGNKFDLLTWDPRYFERLHALMKAADKNGVIVELNLFCPFYEEIQWRLSPMNVANNINGLGDVPRTNVYTLDKHGGLLSIQEELVIKLVRELNRYDNLYYEICNEPYFGGVTIPWQHRIAELIAATEKSLPKKHLISRNVANGSETVTNPHPAISIYNFHYATPPSAVEANYHLNKVIGDNETGFRGTNDLPYRVEAWDFIIAGGGLFNHLDYSFAAGAEDGTFNYPSSQPGGGNPAFRNQMRYLKEFITAFPFTEMLPDKSFIRGGIPANGSGRTLSKRGQHYALYFGPQPPAKDTFSIRWTGSIQSSENGEHTFWTISNDGIRLWIDDKLIIDNWTSHSAKEDRATIALEKDRSYKIKIEYFQSGGNAICKLFWAPPGRERSLVPGSALKAEHTGGEGLQGVYHTGQNFDQKAFTRIDKELNFDWSSTSPFASSTALPPGASQSMELKLDLPRGNYRVQWFDTKKGKYEISEELNHAGGIATVKSPAFDEDIALAINRI